MNDLYHCMRLEELCVHVICSPVALCDWYEWVETLIKLNVHILICLPGIRKQRKVRTDLKTELNSIHGLPVPYASDGDGSAYLNVRQ